MKLINNTVGEVQELNLLSPDLEADDSKMKDIDTKSFTNGTVCGKLETNITLKSAEGGNSKLQNGAVNSNSDGQCNGFSHSQKCDNVSDDDLRLHLTDEDTTDEIDNSIENRDGSAKPRSINDKTSDTTPEKEGDEQESSCHKSVNGIQPEGSGNLSCNGIVADELPESKTLDNGYVEKENKCKEPERNSEKCNSSVPSGTALEEGKEEVGSESKNSLEENRVKEEVSEVKESASSLTADKSGTKVEGEVSNQSENESDKKEEVCLQTSVEKTEMNIEGEVCVQSENENDKKDEVLSSESIVANTGMDIKGGVLDQPDNENDKEGEVVNSQSTEKKVDMDIEDRVCDQSENVKREENSQLEKLENISQSKNEPKRILENDGNLDNENDLEAEEKHPKLLKEASTELDIVAKDSHQELVTDEEIEIDKKNEVEKDNRLLILLDGRESGSNKNSSDDGSSVTEIKKTEEEENVAIENVIEDSITDKPPDEENKLDNDVNLELKYIKQKETNEYVDDVPSSRLESPSSSLPNEGAVAEGGKKRHLSTDSSEEIVKRLKPLEDSDKILLKKRSLNGDNEATDLKRSRIDLPETSGLEVSPNVIKEFNTSTSSEFDRRTCVNGDSSVKAGVDRIESDTTCEEQKLDGAVDITKPMDNASEVKDIFDKTEIERTENKNKTSEKEQLNDISDVPSDIKNKNKLKTNSLLMKELSRSSIIHKEQLKCLTRADLEDLVTMKMCEAISHRCELGDLRQNLQTMEQNVEQWRKKSLLVDKINRELTMVVKKYLKEVEDLKNSAEAGQSKERIVPMKVTRSVGLQVSLVHPAKRLPPPGFYSSKSSSLQHNQQQQSSSSSPSPLPPQQASVQQPSPQQQSLQQPSQQIQHQKDVEPTRSSNGTPPASKPQPVALSTNVETTVRAVVATVPSPSVVQQMQTQALEVIDLTDRDERNRANQGALARGVVPTGGFRVVQRIVAQTNTTTALTPAPAVGQRMTYLVPTSAVQGNQRQLLLATTATNGTAQLRPVTSATVVAGRTPPALAIPANAVFMKSGPVIPMTTQPQGVVMRSQALLPKSGVQQVRVSASGVTPVVTHPAPLPPCPPAIHHHGWLLAPPRPQLKVAKTPNGAGIMLSWTLALTKSYEDIASYQLYAYQESNVPPTSALWKKVGDVKALPLPMACTLTQFVEGHKYHFAVRAVDVHSRVGHFSGPSTIVLQ